MALSISIHTNCRSTRRRQMAEADRDRLSAKIGRQHVTDDQTISPSPEALHLATAVIQRGYILTETMEHPVVKFETHKSCVFDYGVGFSSHWRRVRGRS